MRSVVIPFCLILTATCLRGQESARVKYGFSKMQEADFLAPNQYHLSLVRVEPERDKISLGVFAFRHTLDHPFKLWGFGFAKDGSFSVRFEKFSKLQDNRWEPVPVGYCGTGMQNYEFAPNRDYLLRVQMWPFAKSGDRGVVVLAGDSWLVSDEFDGSKVRAAVGKAKPSR